MIVLSVLSAANGGDVGESISNSVAWRGKV